MFFLSLIIIMSYYINHIRHRPFITVTKVQLNVSLTLFLDVNKLGVDVAYISRTQIILQIPTNHSFQPYADFPPRKKIRILPTMTFWIYPNQKNVAWKDHARMSLNETKSARLMHGLNAPVKSIRFYSMTVRFDPCNQEDFVC